MRKVTDKEYAEALRQRANDMLHGESLMILKYAYKYGVELEERRIYEAVVRHRKKV
jgi:hypothetical protein